MTLYQCHCGKVHDSAEQGPCPQVWTIGPSVRICDHCGDTPLAADGSCPVCVQQVTYTIPGYPPFPLAIIRGGSFRTSRIRGRSAGPRGRFDTCAVVDCTDVEYLTACGQVVPSSLSVWSKAPNCTACRAALRSPGDPVERLS